MTGAAAGGGDGLGSVCARGVGGFAGLLVPADPARPWRSSKTGPGSGSNGVNGRAKLSPGQELYRPSKSGAESVAAVGGRPIDESDRKVATARAQGYTGDQCGNCGSMRVKQNGACHVCDDCGTTSGCS